MLIKPQTTLHNAKVIKKLGKWTVEEYLNTRTGKTSYAISDGWLVYYPIIYDNRQVAYDDPYSIPKSIKTWFEHFAVRTGRGWHGDTPGHKKAATKRKFSSTARTPIKFSLNNYSKTRNFIRDYLDREGEIAVENPIEIMDSMGWIPFDIDKEKLQDVLSSTLSGTTDDVAEAIVNKARGENKGLSDEDIYELVTGHLGSDVPDHLLKYVGNLTEKIGTILSDESANWVAENLRKAKRERGR